jgi:hypothetical protein
MTLSRNKRRITMTGNTEDKSNSAAEIEMMRDVLSMGLQDAENLSVSLVSAGITLSRLFGNS